MNQLPHNRSTNHAKRVPKALQFVMTHEGLVCPADWRAGEDIIVAESEHIMFVLVGPIVEIPVIQNTWATAFANMPA